MIAEYFTRRDAEIYAKELTQLYGPDVHFDVVGMPDPVFGDTVWYVLGTGTVDGEMFAQYAHQPNRRLISTLQKGASCPITSPRASVPISKSWVPS